jgi:hypothetical protein
VIFLGNVTVSLEKKDEDVLRAIAESKYRNKKGSLAKVIAESLQFLSRDSSRHKAMARQFKWLDSGFEMGKVAVRKRGEIYDRR